MSRILIYNALFWGLFGVVSLVNAQVTDQSDELRLDRERYERIIQAKYPSVIRFVSLSDVLYLAEQNNPNTKIAERQIERETALKGSAYMLPSTELLWEAPTSTEMRPGLLQTIPYIGALKSQADAQKQRIAISQTEKLITMQKVKYQASFLYNEIQYLIARVKILQEQDTFYSNIVEITRIRRELGEITKLEQLNAESRYKQVQTQLDATRAQLRGTQAQLAYIIGLPDEKNLVPTELINYQPFTEKPIFDTTAVASNPVLTYNKQQERYADYVLKIEKRNRLPGFTVGYLNQGDNNTAVQYRLRYGISIPISYWAYNSRLNAAKKNLDISRLQTQASTLQLNSDYSLAVSRYRQYGESLQYYEEIGLAQASEILRNAKESYRLGSIPYYNYIQNSELAYQIKLNHLEALRNYNQSILHIRYLRGEL